MTPARATKRATAIRVFLRSLDILASLLHRNRDVEIHDRTRVAQLRERPAARGRRHRHSRRVEALEVVPDVGVVLDPLLEPGDLLQVVADGVEVQAERSATRSPLEVEAVDPEVGVVLHDFRELYQLL